MPPIDPNHLSPTGMRIMPSTVAPIVAPVSPLSASQLNANIDAYVRELAELRKMVLLKIMGEING